MHPNDEQESAIRVIIQPDDGVKPVADFIASSKNTLRLKQFTFGNPELIDAVVKAHRAGVMVQVMLNQHRASGHRANDETFASFEQEGIAVQWSNPAFPITHEKSIVVDGRLAMISTYNLCTKYFHKTRDFGIITSHRPQVEQIEECFRADWERRPFSPPTFTGLLWGNINARILMSEFIDQAKHHLDVNHPKFVDTAILSRLVEAKRRGVHVRILCGGGHGLNEWDAADTFSSLRILHHMEIKVRRKRHLHAHGKLMIADSKRALLGSMNIDRTGFIVRRELGIIVDDKPVLARLCEVFDSDWEKSHHYEAPDPLQPASDDDLPRDPEIVHD